MAKIKNGIVESVKFTDGGAGNQWTTISGVQYATFWNIMTKDWKIGDNVTFTVSNRPLFGNTLFLHADNIKLIRS